MTITESLIWSLIRCLIVASFSLIPVAILTRQIESSADSRVRGIWTFAAICPFFVPELLIGFNYRLTATQLIQGTTGTIAGVSTEILYLLLLIGRSTAFGVAVRQIVARSAVSAESLHIWNRLKSSISTGQMGSITKTEWRLGWLKLHLSGPWRSSLIAWSIMALVSFQEFETAALMQIDRYPISWSVWLFDAHAARQPLRESLKMILGPLAIEAVLLSPALWMILWHSPKSSIAALTLHADARKRVASRLPAIICLIPGLLLFLIWPFSVNFLSAVRGLGAMLQNITMLQMAAEQILTSTGFSIAAAILAINLSGLLQPTEDSRCLGSPTSKIPLRTVVLLVPGLMGSLVMSLLIVAIFQQNLFRPLYDTWLPMLLGQTLAIFPRSFALVIIMNQTKDPSALNSVSLLTNSPDFGIRQNMSRIYWRMSTFRWLLCATVIAQWCFWDVTTTAILRPVQLEPVVTRLYNEMHYGRTESLMSLAGLALLIPAFFWVFIAVLTWSKAIVSPSLSPNSTEV